MWTYKMIKPLLPGEDVAAAFARLEASGRFVLVERNSELPVFHVAAGDLHDDRAKFLVENPKVLPQEVQIGWVSDAIVEHVRADGDETIRQTAAKVAEVHKRMEAEIEERRRKLRGEAAAEGLGGLAGLAALGRRGPADG